MTPRAREFIARNKSNAVTESQWLDATGRNARLISESVRLRFRFTDGRTLSLRRADLSAVSAAGHQVRWHGFENTEITDLES